MKEVRARLSKKINRASSVASFRFNLEEKLDFLPGQYAQIIFDETDRSNKELNKYLSFSSSPAKGYVEFTKRLSESRFSRSLKSLEPGSSVLLKAPLGNCVFEDSYKQIGFLTGGIGITPVISIIEYIVQKQLDTDVLVLYSNRTDEDIAFKKELDDWQVRGKHIKVFYIITDCMPKDQTCIRGVINREMILEKIYGLDKRIFFIYGPTKMVEVMNNLCLDLGCDSQSVKAERFIGY